MLLAFVCVLVVLIYTGLSYHFKFWKRKNVPFISTSVYSSIVSPFYNPIPFFDHYVYIYAQLSGKKYGGTFWNFQPQFVVRDPELIKCILTKDFEHFRDRGITIFNEHDPITNNLFSAPATLWKALRVQLTPIFTSGRIKFMFGTVDECAKELQQMIEKSVNRNELLNFKDFCLGYTIRVINSTAFGWKTNSADDLNDVFKNVNRVLAGKKYRLRNLIYIWFPFLKPYVKIHLLPQAMNNFFFNSVRETVEYRRKTGYTRNDFIQLLMTLNEQSMNENEKNDNRSQYKLKWTNELMTAQCFLFFAAGSDTSSTILSMTFLELAMNEDIQNKLHEEIDIFSDANDGNITYELIKSMPYLHKVVQETLRKYPVLPFLSRVCTKTYNVPDTDIIIEKGTDVVIPIAGIHRDAEIYPNPEVYDPERFNPEEIQSRHKFQYLPFGEGPRNCIGARFGLIAVKLGIIYILKKFHLKRTPNTVYPMRFTPNRLGTVCDCPVVFQCLPRLESCKI